MQLFEIDVELSGHVQGHAGENRMPLGKKGVERSTEAVVVHLLDRHAPQDVGPGLLSPSGHVAKCNRVVKPRGNQQGQNHAMRELGLRIFRQMSVDHVRHIHTFKQRPNHGQRPQVATTVCRLVSVPCKCHPYKMAKTGRWRNMSFGKN